MIEMSHYDEEVNVYQKIKSQCQLRIFENIPFLELLNSESVMQLAQVRFVSVNVSTLLIDTFIPVFITNCDMTVC